MGRPADLGVWSVDQPPNEQWVEVYDENTGNVIQVMAIWGRDGTLPHWKGKDGTLYTQRAFKGWRPITPVWTNI